MERQEISRRRFLKDAAVAAGAWGWASVLAGTNAAGAPSEVRRQSRRVSHARRAGLRKVGFARLLAGRRAWRALGCSSVWHRPEDRQMDRGLRAPQDGRLLASGQQAEFHRGMARRD